MRADDIRGIYPIPDRKGGQGGKQKRRDLGPESAKPIVKERVTQSILQQVAGVKLEDVYRRVNEIYERLLSIASVTSVP